jgi:mRNA deadenylase 3'-5' endonuclease subunit Ccr4
MKLISVNIESNLHDENVLTFFKKEKADVVCVQELLEESFELYKKELNLEGVYQTWSYWNNQKVLILDQFFMLGKKETFKYHLMNIFRMKIFKKTKHYFGQK